MLVHELIFNVAGVTFENEEGKDIQTEIKKTLQEYKKCGEIDEKEDLFGGYSNKDIKEDDLSVDEYEGINFKGKIVQTTYENEDCYKIYFIDVNGKDIHIGYMPKKKIAEANEWFSKDGLEFKSNLEIIGGKNKHLEEVENSNGDLVEKVVVDEDTYGARISLSFFDNKEQIKQPSKINSQTSQPSEKDRRGIAIGIIIFIFLVLIGIATNPQSFNNVSNEMNITTNEQNN